MRIRDWWMASATDSRLIPVVAFVVFVLLVGAAWLLALTLNDLLPPVRTFAPGAMLKPG